jgi:hypothetical protein
VELYIHSPIRLHDLDLKHHSRESLNFARTDVRRDSNNTHSPLVSMLQWWLEQPALLLCTARQSPPAARGAITCLAAIVRSTAWGTSPGGTCHGSRHLHNAVREPAGAPPAGGVPRRASGGVHTCESRITCLYRTRKSLSRHYTVP